MEQVVVLSSKSSPISSSRRQHRVCGEIKRGKTYKKAGNLHQKGANPRTMLLLKSCSKSSAQRQWSRNRFVAMKGTTLHIPTHGHCPRPSRHWTGITVVETYLRQSSTRVLSSKKCESIAKECWDSLFYFGALYCDR